MNTPKKVILHCSATPDYKKGHISFDLFGASDIDSWHRSEKGWDMIGYHEVIRRTGLLEHGRPHTMHGAHTLGHNVDSLGVCYIGLSYPTKEQIDTLGTVFLKFLADYGIKANQWFGHYELNVAKLCPGFSMDVFRAYLERLQWAFHAKGALPG